MNLNDQALVEFQKAWDEWQAKFPEAEKYHYTAREWFIRGFKANAGSDAAKGRESDGA